MAWKTDGARGSVYSSMDCRQQHHTSDNDAKKRRGGDINNNATSQI